MNLQYWDPSGWEARAERAALEAERRGRYDDAPGTPPPPAAWHHCPECGAWATDACCQITAQDDAPAQAATSEADECPF